MRLAGKVLVHQAHLAKIGADVTALVVSDVLLWKGWPRAAIVVRVALPVAGSAAVLSLADVDALAMTRRGQYVLAHMPPSAQVVRLAGDALMGLGARRHRPALLLAGAVVIMAGWSHAACRERLAGHDDHRWPQPCLPGMRHQRTVPRKRQCRTTATRSST